jgi:hypothetical protein
MSVFVAVAVAAPVDLDGKRRCLGIDHINMTD